DSTASASERVGRGPLPTRSLALAVLSGTGARPARWRSRCCLRCLVALGDVGPNGAGAVRPRDRREVATSDVADDDLDEPQRALDLRLVEAAGHLGELGKPGPRRLAGQLASVVADDRSAHPGLVELG